MSVPIRGRYTLLTFDICHKLSSGGLVLTYDTSCRKIGFFFLPMTYDISHDIFAKSVKLMT